MSATDITGPLARYMAEARQRTLPPHVAREGKHRILDSLAAKTTTRGSIFRSGTESTSRIRR